MFPFAQIINPLAIMMSLSTATGVLVHDVHLNSVSAALLAPPPVVADTNASPAMTRLSNDLHNHIERVSFSQTVRDLHTANPRVQPRNEDKKYLMQKQAHGFNPAGDTFLPLD